MEVVAELCHLIDEFLPFWFGHSSGFKLHSDEVERSYFCWTAGVRELEVPLQQATSWHWIPSISAVSLDLHLGASCHAMLSGHPGTSLAQITLKVPKHSRHREGQTRLPRSWCYAALCAGLPQAVTYRHCSQILGKGGCLPLVTACTVTKHHLPLPFFFFFSWLPVHEPCLHATLSQLWPL